MNKPRTLIAAALAALLFAAPAIAQEQGTATLRVDIGSAMVSTGGEFSTAPSGAELEAGNRVMLAEGNQVTLVYRNGCTRTLTTPGVHAVGATCVPAGLTNGSGTVGGATGVDVGGLAIVSGIAVAGAAILHAMDDEPYVEPPPVSR